MITHTSTTTIMMMMIIALVCAVCMYIKIRDYYTAPGPSHCTGRMDRNPERPSDMCSIAHQELRSESGVQLKKKRKTKNKIWKEKKKTRVRTLIITTTRVCIQGDARQRDGRTARAFETLHDDRIDSLFRGTKICFNITIDVFNGEKLIF